jgi:hypothetical protein
MILYTFTPEQICLMAIARSVWDRRGAAKRTRLRLGEETITDCLLLDLANQFPGDIKIAPFNRRQEGKVGADWAWAFQNADRTRTMPMLVQAKLLDDRGAQYPEIARKIGKGDDRQIDQLIQNAESLGWPALYAFYNHIDDTGRIPDRCRSLSLTAGKGRPKCWGVSIADAYRVREALPDMTFDTHRAHSMPLHCLLCSAGTGTRGDFGSPGRVLNALHFLRALGSDSHPSRTTEYPPLPLIPMEEEPELVGIARQLVDTEDTQVRDHLQWSLSERFPSIEGVVILRDRAD